MQRWLIAALSGLLWVSFGCRTALAHPLQTPACTSASPCRSLLGPGQQLSYPTFTVSLAQGSNAVTVSYDGSALTASIAGPFGLQTDAAVAAKCQHLNGMLNQVRCLAPQGQFQLMAAPPNPGGGVCKTATLPAGWNLVSGQLAAVITTNIGPVYTYSTQAGAYASPAESSDIIPTGGYWVFFDQPTLVGLGCSAPPGVRMDGRMVTISIDSGWTMIGNALPVPGTAEVTGGDVVYVYDPVKGYESATNLTAEQGAWVYSATGGTVILTAVDSGF